jgi:hypothetical protein
MTHTILIVALWSCAAGALAAVGVIAFRIWGTPRETTTPEPPHAATPAPRRTLRMLVVPGARREQAETGVPAGDGATEAYGAELAATTREERALSTVAAELDLDMLDPQNRPIVQDALALRLAVAEDIEHFDGRMVALLDAFDPEWSTKERPIIATAHTFTEARELAGVSA